MVREGHWDCPQGKYTDKKLKNKKWPIYWVGLILIVQSGVLSRRHFISLFLRSQVSVIEAIAFRLPSSANQNAPKWESPEISNFLPGDDSPAIITRRFPRILEISEEGFQ